jgi:hypothetical protein
MSRVLVWAITAPDVITPDAATAKAIREEHPIENTYPATTARSRIP